MTAAKQLWILTGGNGAGKSTFYSQYLAKRGLAFVNADLIAKTIDPDAPEKLSYEAATIAGDIREDLIAQGVSFCFETVFSHPSKIDFIAMAKARGYTVILVYIHLFDPSLNEARVHQRVLEGGHDVPADKIRARIPRTLENVKASLPLVDEAWILDNSSAGNRFAQVFTMKSSRFEIKTDPLPDWAQGLLP
ncbi:Predicted ABC-type ATPase [Desulfatibacillum alkenivorans DSM 16219]|jgi:predicted ABC-type ATPase|uniref:Predicted ABC-type ATPase n=1 Tax=Desulfatibacillum alkenivorans DSM 16219 TaxID=1121393 RepID=A0A1M6FDV0_9BACT|nr:AAA family ATPase [Desulfatibacillum alkenivorans]SHI95910.1 Predicted ABC-type ATPase [Desulfatibacillum alkenivorans DSM 16219]